MKRSKLDRMAGISSPAKVNTVITLDDIQKAQSAANSVLLMTESRDIR